MLRARLSERAPVVAWAQRSTSLAAGISSTRDNTIAQHVADLHAVRQALAMRYPEATRVVLAGHSWGVALTLAYLDQHGESGLAGLLLADGFDAYGDDAERSLARLAELADARADASVGSEADAWGEVVRFARGAAEEGAGCLRTPGGRA